MGAQGPGGRRRGGGREGGGARGGGAREKARGRRREREEEQQGREVCSTRTLDGRRVGGGYASHRVLEAFQLLLEATDLLVELRTLIELEADAEPEEGQQAQDHDAGDGAGSYRWRIQRRIVGASREDNSLGNVDAHARHRVHVESGRLEFSNAVVCRQGARQRHREPTRSRLPVLVQPTAASRELHVVNLGGRRTSERARRREGGGERGREGEREREREREREIMEGVERGQRGSAA